MFIMDSMVIYCIMAGEWDLELLFIYAYYIFTSLCVSVVCVRPSGLRGGLRGGGALQRLSGAALSYP